MVLLETASRDHHGNPSLRCTAHVWPASPDRLTRALVLGVALWCAVLAGAQAAEEGGFPRRAAYSGRVQTEPVAHAVPEAALAAPRVMRVSTATQVDPPSDPNEPLFRETAAADTAAAGPATTASTHTGKTGRPVQMAPAAGAEKALANKAVGSAAARSKAAPTSATRDRVARHGQTDHAGKAEKRTAAVGRSRTQREAERIALQRRGVHKPEAGHIPPRTGQPLAARSQDARRPQAPSRHAKAHAGTTSRPVASSPRSARSARSIPAPGLATKPTARPHRQLAQAAGAKAPARDARARHQTAQAGKGARRAAHGAPHTVANTVAHDATRKADAAPAVSPSRKLRQAKAGGPRPAAAQPSGKPVRQAARQAAVRPAGSHHASARHGRPVPADPQRPAKPRG